MSPFSPHSYCLFSLQSKQFYTFSPSLSFYISKHTNLLLKILVFQLPSNNNSTILLSPSTVTQLPCNSVKWNHSVQARQKLPHMPSSVCGAFPSSNPLSIVPKMPFLLEIRCTFFPPFSSSGILSWWHLNLPPLSYFPLLLSYSGTILLDGRKIPSWRKEVKLIQCFTFIRLPINICIIEKNIQSVYIFYWYLLDYWNKFIWWRARFFWAK